MMKWHNTIALLALLLIALFWVPEQASAQSPPPAPIDLPEIGTAGLTCDAPSLDNGVLYPMVMCMQAILDIVAVDFITTVSDTVGRFVMAICTLALVLLGVKITMGAAKIGPETNHYIVRLVIVMVIGGNPDLVIDWWHIILDISNELGVIVMTAVKNATGSGLEGCALVNINETSSIFQNLDCIFISMIRGAKNMTDTEAFFGIGMVSVGLLWSGVIGMTITLLAIGMILTLLMASVQAVLLYVTAMIALIFLAAIAPLVLPMIFFERTRNMVSEWRNSVLSYSLQPVVLVAYLVMMVIVISILANNVEEMYEDAYNTMEGEAGKKLVTILELDPAQLSEDRMLELEQQSQENPIPTPSCNYFTWRQTSAINNPQQAGAKIVHRFATETQTDCFNIETQLPFLDWPPDKRRQFYAYMLAAFLIFWLMYSFLRALPDLLSSLVTKGIVADIANYANRLPNMMNAGVESKLPRSK